MTHLLLIIIYLAFIGLGLPDSLFGAAWPSIYPGFQVPVSYAGIVSLIISCGTVASSLFSDKLIRRFGAGLVTAVSVALTAGAILGFSVSRSYPALCVFAVPYGVGAGSVDTALNNFAALHYSARHMSWLHCTWGVGTVVGPYVIGYGLTSGEGWQFGYRCMFFVQLILTIVLFLSLPMWNRQSARLEAVNTQQSSLPLREILRVPGVKSAMIAFFCYCGLENTSMLWAGTYLNLHLGFSAESAARFASLPFIGITAGRAVNGLLASKFTDDQLIRIGSGILVLGCVLMLLPFGVVIPLAGLLLVGVGCAPMYPCIVHSTPEHFGAALSQSVMSVEIASAYVGISAMSPLFGVVARALNVSLLPAYILLLACVMMLFHAKLVQITKNNRSNES